ncbi:hypothetical protein K470DRAFT_254595, partial [Piedraia hortae CBS 480.64]
MWLVGYGNRCTSSFGGPERRKSETLLTGWDVDNSMHACIYPSPPSSLFITITKMTSEMKEAVKGAGGGLQAISSKVGDAIADKSDIRGSEQRKSDNAGNSIGEMAGKGGGDTVIDTTISGGEQGQNQTEGSANHLNL